MADAEHDTSPCAVCQKTELDDETCCRPCQHRFCRVCISEWVFKMTSTCPVCRKAVKQLYLANGKFVEVPTLERRQEHYTRDLLPENTDDEDSFVEIDEAMIMEDQDYRPEEEEEEEEYESDNAMEEDTPEYGTIPARAHIPSPPTSCLHPEYDVFVGACRDRQTADVFARGKMPLGCMFCNNGAACDAHGCTQRTLVHAKAAMAGRKAILAWENFWGTAKGAKIKLDEVNTALWEELQNGNAGLDDLLVNATMAGIVSQLSTKTHPFVFVQVHHTGPVL